MCLVGIILWRLAKGFAQIDIEWFLNLVSEAINSLANVRPATFKICRLY